MGTKIPVNWKHLCTVYNRVKWKSIPFLWNQVENLFPVGKWYNYIIQNTYVNSPFSPPPSPPPRVQLQVFITSSIKSNTDYTLALAGLSWYYFWKWKHKRRHAKCVEVDPFLSTKWRGRRGSAFCFCQCHWRSTHSWQGGECINGTTEWLHRRGKNDGVKHWNCRLACGYEFLTGKLQFRSNIWKILEKRVSGKCSILHVNIISWNTECIFLSNSSCVTP